MPKTSCWRGYIATWEIIDKYLYLKDIQYFAIGEDQGIDYVFLTIQETPKLPG
jgi:hypothetical protein